MKGFRLPVDPRVPFDWPAVLSYFEARATPGVERVEGGCYRRRFECAGEELTIEVSADGTRHLRVKVDRTAAFPDLEARMRRVFDLDADLPAIAAHLCRDPRLAALLARRPAARIAGAFDPFELGVRAILGQQVSVTVATRLAGRLAARCARSADPLRSDGLTYLFPGPREILSADLSNMGMPGARVRSIQRLSEAVETDPDLLASSGDYERDIERLRALPGIGDWTAQYIALRALGHRDAFPASDIGLLRAMSVDGVRPSAAELAELAEAWRPWRGYAAMFLWSSPDGAASPGSRTRPGSKGRDSLDHADARAASTAVVGAFPTHHEMQQHPPTAKNRPPRP